MISGYSLCNDPEECSSQLLKLILRINKNIWIYNALWSICNLQPPCTPINLHRLLPSEFSISQFFFTHSTETTFPPPCFIQQYGRINHITALPLIFLGQSKQVLKYVDSMTGIWMKSQLMKNVNTLRKDDGDLRFYITTVQDGWRKSASPVLNVLKYRSRTHNKNNIIKFDMQRQSLDLYANPAFLYFLHY